MPAGSSATQTVQAADAWDSFSDFCISSRDRSYFLKVCSTVSIYAGRRESPIRRENAGSRKRFSGKHVLGHLRITDHHHQEHGQSKHDQGKKHNQGHHDLLRLGILLLFREEFRQAGLYIFCELFLLQIVR